MGVLVLASFLVLAVGVPLAHVVAALRMAGETTRRSHARERAPTPGVSRP